MAELAEDAALSLIVKAAEIEVVHGVGYASALDAVIAKHVPQLQRKGITADDVRTAIQVEPSECRRQTLTKLCSALNDVHVIRKLEVNQMAKGELAARTVRIIKSENEGEIEKLTKAELYQAILDGAATLRKVGETREAAAVRYMRKTEDGRLLRRQYQVARGPSAIFEKEKEQPKLLRDISPSWAELENLAAAHRRASKKELTPEMAMSHILRTEAGQELRRRHYQEMEIWRKQQMGKR